MPNAVRDTNQFRPGSKHFLGFLFLRGYLRIGAEAVFEVGVEDTEGSGPATGTVLAMSAEAGVASRPGTCPGASCSSAAESDPSETCSLSPGMKESSSAEASKSVGTGDGGAVQLFI